MCCAVDQTRYYGYLTSHLLFIFHCVQTAKITSCSGSWQCAKLRPVELTVNLYINQLEIVAASQVNAAPMQKRVPISNVWS